MKRLNKFQREERDKRLAIINAQSVRARTKLERQMKEFKAGQSYTDRKSTLS